MKSYTNYVSRDDLRRDDDGRLTGFVLSGEAVIFSQLDREEREVYVFKQFQNRARQTARYCCNAHDMTEEQARAYIASGLYAKFLDIRESDVKKNGYFNITDFFCMLKTFSQLKHALMRSNHVATVAYTQKVFIPETTISFKNGYAQTIPAHYVGGDMPELPEIHNGKLFDIIDVLDMWENRYTRKRARLADAIEALNEARDVKLTIDDARISEDDARAIRQEQYKQSRDKNDLRRLTELNGDYGTPESALIHWATMERARITLSKKDKRLSDVLKIVASSGNMTDKARQTLARFRDRNALFYNVYSDDGKLQRSEPITRDELIYLCK
jgi:hypothetical protein